MAQRRSPDDGNDPQQAWRKATTIGSSRGRFGEERNTPLPTPREEQDPFRLARSILSVLPLGIKGGQAAMALGGVRPRKLSNLSAPFRETSNFSKMTFAEPQGVFEKNIAMGRLSRDQQSPLYAGKWMYMGTNEAGHDLFKNIDTRQYLPTD